MGEALFFVMMEEQKKTRIFIVCHINHNLLQLYLQNKQNLITRLFISSSFNIVLIFPMAKIVHYQYRYDMVRQMF